MCDTFVVRSTAGRGYRLLGKNSDREPNEAQAIERVRACHTDASDVACTYVSIPQVPVTYEVILSRPHQMWGAEMGINEHGLAIGNEAVFTRLGFDRTNDGLTGMDMNRLVLERCKSAEEAVDLLVHLVETYGQDACGGYEDKKFFYHNSFLVSDGRSTWLFETADRFWAARRIVGPCYAISNGLTIEEDYDKGSDRMEEEARARGWVRKGEHFNFRKAFSDRLYTHFSRCAARRNCIMDRRPSGQLEEAISILSTHSHEDPTRVSAASLCMHANSPLNPSVSTGSMIVEWLDRGAVCWLTGTSNPCMSLYIPFVPGGQALTDDRRTLPGPRPDGSLWWEAEKLHRKVLNNHACNYPLISEDRIRVQQAIIRSFRELVDQGADTAALDDFAARTLDMVMDKIRDWTRWVDQSDAKTKASLRYRWYMHGFSKRAGLNV